MFQSIIWFLFRYSRILHRSCSLRTSLQLWLLQLHLSWPMQQLHTLVWHRFLHTSKLRLILHARIIIFTHFFYCFTSFFHFSRSTGANERLPDWTGSAPSANDAGHIFLSTAATTSKAAASTPTAAAQYKQFNAVSTATATAASGATVFSSKVHNFLNNHYKF